MRLPRLALVALVLSTPLHAAEPTNMISIDGTCESIVIAGDDLSADCKGSLIQMIYDIGRVGLYAFAGDTVVTFSGLSDEVIDDEIHQQLDQVIIGLSETDVTTIPTRGTCVFENPYGGTPARFTCSARSKAGDLYELSFLTDGNEPVDVMAD